MKQNMKQLIASVETDISGKWVRADNVEKLVELVVRECVNIAHEYDKPKLSGPGLAIASDIESHFDIYIEEDETFSCSVCGLQNPTTSCGLPNCGLII